MAKAPVTIEEKKVSPIPNYGKPTVSSVRSERPSEVSRRDAGPLPEVSRRDSRPTTLILNDNVQIFEKSTIKLDREVYSKKGFNENIDIEFEELTKKEDNFSPTQFFQLYDSLFFDIPKVGNNSHASLVNRSKQYMQGIDTLSPKDEIINNLNNRIIELEQELLQNNQLDPEHPFFKNGTLVAEEINGERTGKFYYMDKGFKRKVNYTNSFYKTLLKVLGYESSTDYPNATVNMLSQIKTGPNLGAGNFEQPTFIRDGEMFVGENITDDTKDAQINNLRAEVNTLNRQIEDLQDLLNEANTGPVSQDNNNENLGGAFSGGTTFGGIFGSNNTFGGTFGSNNTFGGTFGSGNNILNSGGGLFGNFGPF